MKRLKYFSLALVALVGMSLFYSCETREDWRFPELGYGGFIKFVEQPYSWEGLQTVTGEGPAFSITKYHVGEDPATSDFIAMTEDPTGNVALFEMFVRGFYTGASDDPIPWKSTTTFPWDVSYSAQDMADHFGVDVSTFVTGDQFEFSSLTTTVDGRVYNSNPSNCDCPIVLEEGNPGTYNQGNIDVIILQGGDTGTNDLVPAVRYRVKYLAASD